MRLWRGIAADPVGQPHDDCNHSKPSQSAHSPSNFLILKKQTPLAEKNPPIVLAGTDTGQGLGAGVGHVCANVRKVFKEPKAAESKAGRFPLPEEINCAEQRHKQFGKRAAENHDGMAEPTEEEMSAFVDDQIDEIQDEKPGAVSERIEEEKYVKTKPGNPGATRDRLPFSEFVFEKGHWPKRSKCTSAEKGSSDNVCQYQPPGRTSANTARPGGCYLSAAANASYAAPRSGADSLSTMDTGMLLKRPSNFHLSLKA